MKNDTRSTLGAFLILIALISCKHTDRDSSVKFRQYYLKGEQLYLQHCSNCHQNDGSGLKLLYPPLDSADFLLSRPDEALCIIKNGRNGELIVNDRNYNQPMPAFPNLTDIEIAQIATYICNSWSNRIGIFEVKDVSQNLAKCSAD